MATTYRHLGIDNAAPPEYIPLRHALLGYIVKTIIAAPPEYIPLRPEKDNQD